MRIPNDVVRKIKKDALENKLQIVVQFPDGTERAVKCAIDPDILIKLLRQD